MTTTPLETLRLCRELITLAEKVLGKGNSNALSDAFVGVSQANAAAEGAFLNVRINLPEVNDQVFVTSTLEEAELLMNEISKIHKRLFASVRKQI